jgi:hypothetical protein
MAGTFEAALRRLLRRPAPSQSCGPVYQDWQPDLAQVEIEITSFCNLRCINCDRSCRQAPSTEHMTPGQVEAFCRESVAAGRTWSTITLIGGEPTLHPQLDDVLEVMGSYRRAIAHEVVLATNGFGEAVQRRLKRLPGWLTVRNTAKKSPVQAFHAYNMAPCDDVAYDGRDFGFGCWVPQRMGIGLTRYGYYCCGAGAAVDRVFGMDIGLKRLADVAMPALKGQMRQLCRLCGHFHSNFSLARTTQEAYSPSWERAYRRYAARPPVLSLYGQPSAVPSTGDRNRQEYEPVG